MARCTTIRSKRRRLCIADLIHEIQVVDRSIVPPDHGETIYTIEFDIETSPVVFASCETPRGIKIFDSTNLEQDVTHRFGVYFDPSYTVENFVFFKNRFFRILDANNLDERDEWTILSCVERGSEAKAANYV